MIHYQLEILGFPLLAHLDCYYLDRYNMGIVTKMCSNHPIYNIPPDGLPPDGLPPDGLPPDEPPLDEPPTQLSTRLQSLH